MSDSVITVRNAEGEPDTQAQIIIQNKIDYTPKVSVIIPVYNTEEYLRECMDSVINQTLKEIEIICVDDGSTDGSLSILKEYAKKDERITVMAQENQGAGIARNCGISVATGEFIAFMDSDDLYPKNETLETMYVRATENNVLICGGSLSQIKDKELITDPTQFEEGYSFQKDEKINYFDYQFDYGYWRFIYNAKFIKNNKLHFPNYLRFQDPPFFIKAMNIAGDFYALKEATYVYRTSYKQIQWTERKALDTVKGLTDVLKYSKDSNLEKLHCKTAKRIVNPYFLRAFKILTGNEATKSFLGNMVSAMDWTIICNHSPGFSLAKFYESLPNMPKVSVIIPVYNVENYLRECLDSVINQTLKEIEIICVNDGSKDGSLKILKEYAAKDDRITIIDQQNQGLPNARNSGLKVSNGLCIMFVDSDDWIDKDYIEDMYNAIIENEADMAKSVYKHHYPDKIIDDTINETIRKRHAGKQCLKMFENNIVVWASLYKKEFLINQGILYFEPDILRHEDILYTLKAVTFANKIVPIADTYYHYRRTSSVLSSFVYERAWLIPTITYRAVDFINAHVASTEDYIKSAQRLVWRLIDTYEHLKDYPRFSKDENMYKDKMTDLIIRMRHRRAVTLPYQKKLEDINIVVKSALVVEVNNFHGECVLGHVKYLMDLGYSVDVLLNSAMESENPLRNIFDNSVHVEFMNPDEIILKLKNGYASEYDVCLLNSNTLYEYNFLATDIVRKTDSSTKILAVEHRQDNISSKVLETSSVLVLKKFNFEVNPHYFGIIPDHNKHKVTQFITAGNIESFRKNHEMLKNAVSQLVDGGYENFHVTVIGKGSLGEIPEKIARHITATGRISYDEMYKRMAEADFFLPLLNPENSEHNRYLSSGTSGSFQLIYGFNLPCIIEQKFAATHLFTKDNSIIYCQNRTFADALKAAIDMPEEKYRELKSALKETSQNIYESSLHNLEQAIKQPTPSNHNNTSSPLLYKDIGLGCNTWCEPRNVGGNAYTYDLSDNIYTRYVSWAPIKEGSCDVEILRLSAVERRSGRVVEFPVDKIISSGKITGSKVEFRNQKCWIGCAVEGAYESFAVEASVSRV